MDKKQISGWYVSEEKELEKEKQIEEWYDKIITGGYRNVSVEAPAKMILALGRLAQERGVSFQDLVEGILEEYLATRDIQWRSL